MRTMAKIDCYDYFILPGVIQIAVRGTNDPILVDILSEVERANGRIYVEGHHFIMQGYDIHRNGEQTYLHLQVITID